MKKLFAILAVACVMASCTGADSDKNATADTTKKDSLMTDAKQTMDSASKMVTNATDSANKMVTNATDTAKKMVKDATEKVKEATKH